MAYRIRYLRKLELWHTGAFKNFPRAFFSDADLTFLRMTLLNALHLQAAEATAWLRAIQDGMDEPLKILIMALSPNLHTLVFVQDASPTWSPLYYLSPFLLEYARHRPWQSHPFASLKNVHLQHLTDERHRRDHWCLNTQDCMAFLTLPKIEKLWMHCPGILDAEPEEWEFDQGSSAIKELNFDCSDLPEGSVMNMIRAAKGLVAFRYTTLMI